MGKAEITVPLKFDGFDIGEAVVVWDGRDMVVTAHIDETTPVGKELYETLLFDMADAISIRPNYIPAIPKDKR